MAFLATYSLFVGRISFVNLKLGRGNLIFVKDIIFPLAIHHPVTNCVFSYIEKCTSVFHIYNIALISIHIFPSITKTFIRGQI